MRRKRPAPSEPIEGSKSDQYPPNGSSAPKQPAQATETRSLRSMVSLRAVVWLTLWYFCNVFTLILNKQLFASGFTYPLSLTCLHFASAVVGSIICVQVFRVVPLMRLSYNAILTRCFPFAVIFCANIVLGNVGLRWIPVSFFSVVKTAVPAFTVLLEFLLFQRTYDRRIYAALVPIISGVALASYSEVNFNWTGFLACFAASILSALQTVVCAWLMDSAGIRLDAFNLLLYMAPMATAMLLPVAWRVEGPAIAASGALASEGTVLVLFLSGAVAFGLSATQFMAIKVTSSLSFNVAGNFKAVLAIVISVAIFRNQITILNAFGCLMAIGGVAWYVHLRHKLNAAKASPLSREPNDAELIEGDNLAMNHGTSSPRVVSPPPSK
eukprot:tig00020964_g16781.t2